MCLWVINEHRQRGEDFFMSFGSFQTAMDRDWFQQGKKNWLQAQEKNGFRVNDRRWIRRKEIASVRSGPASLHETPRSFNIPFQPLMCRNQIFSVRLLLTGRQTGEMLATNQCRMFCRFIPTPLVP
jgi:hypothetical protein